ncbi:MAG TPA: hypothetical protein VFK50_04095 [Sphingomicrobium sp.]|nr:hypothetical protein [Sphingomicrobium sp.]
MSPPLIGRSSASPRRSPTNADTFMLAGPSNDPDPAFNAYRQDLADVSLAGRVIASHYAEPLARQLLRPAALRSQPSDDSELVRDLDPGVPFDMLDNSLGWAWGYAGADRRVGYVRSEALGL